MRIRIPLPARRRRSQSGSAVVIVTAMVAIMAICVAVNVASIRTVDRELKLMEKKQIQRLQSSSTKSAANTPTASDTIIRPHDREARND